MAEPAIVDVLLLVTQALESLGVRYYIGGSLASIAYGEIRLTHDADVIADLQPDHAQTLVNMLGKDFYIDEEMILEAIEHKRSFNLIHYQSIYKVDVFIPAGRPFDQNQLDRRVDKTLSDRPVQRAYVASPEDTVLAKLEWYEMGHRVSERQWRDALGVLAVQAGRLDLAYLRRWAAELKLSDLLERALVEAEN